MGQLVGKHCFSHKYNIFFFRFPLVLVSTQILATVPFVSSCFFGLYADSSYSTFCFLLFRSLRRFQLQYLLIPGFEILFQVLSFPKPFRAIFFGYVCYGTGAVLHFLLSAFARKSCCSTADSMNRLCDSRILEFFSFLLGLFLPTALLCCCDCYGWEIPTQYYTQQIFLHKNVAL